MKKLIVLALVLGMVASASAVTLDFAAMAPDASLDVAELAAMNLTVTEDGGPLVTSTVALGGGGLDWGMGGGGAYNNDLLWKPSQLDITTVPVQTFTIKYRIDSEPNINSRFAAGPANNESKYYTFSEHNSAGNAVEITGARDPRNDLMLSFPNGAPGYDTYFVMLQYELDFANDTWKARLGDDNGGEVWGAWVNGNDSIRNDTIQVEGMRVYGYGGSTIESISWTPEPATIALLGMGALALIRKRR